MARKFEIGVDGFFYSFMSTLASSLQLISVFILVSQNRETPVTYR